MEYVEPQLGFAQRAALELTTAVLPTVDALLDSPRWPLSVSRWLEAAMEPLEFAARLNDPRGIYAYCFCDVR